MASVVDICNRALQHLGAQRIVSLTQDSANARSCNVCYETLRDAMLEEHPWAFAIKRATLAADSTAPDWGRAYGFQLPTDFMRPLLGYPETNFYEPDYLIESGKIYTNVAAPLYIRYVARVTDPTLMPALFREALSARMAAEMAEEITQSNSKKESCLEFLKLKIGEAKRQNAILKPPEDPYVDEWVLARRSSIDAQG